MTKKILLLLIVLLTGLSASAKVKVREICPALKFEGEELVKNKETNQKEPLGEGVLFVPYGKSSKPDDAILSITGTFQGNRIDNACVKAYAKAKKGEVEYVEVFNGKLEYSFTYDKKRNKLQLELDFKDGVLYVEQNRYPLSINAQYPISYSIEVGPDSFTSIDIKPSRKDGIIQLTHLQILDPIGDMITRNDYLVKWNGNKRDRDSVFWDYWDLEWLQTTLNNGMTCSWIEEKGLLFKGDNDTYLNSDDELRLPTKDNGVFERNRKKRIIKLTYPTGEIYEGSFSKVPFKLGKDEDKFDESSILRYDFMDGNVELFKQIVSSTTSDFVPFNGVYTYPDGAKKHILKGIDLTQKVRNANNGKVLPSKEEIAATHMFVDYQDNCVGPSIDAYNLVDRLSKSILDYAGKGNGDELDRALYLKSEQYKIDKQAYDSLRTNQLFYSYEAIKYSSFNTSGITIKYLDCDNDFEVLRVANGHISIPCKGTFHKGTWESLNLYVPINDIDILKLLKEYQKTLGFIVTFKAGECYRRGPIVNPVAFYIYDTTSGKVLADVSSVLTTKSSAEIQKITAEQKRKDAIEEKKRNEKYRYHKQAKREICTSCHGRGYRYDSYGNEHNCINCMGKGYYDTHYYED